MKPAVAAFQFLTIVRFAREKPLSAEQIGRAAPFFPLVGLVLGLALLLLDRLLQPYLESEILSAVDVAALAVMTGAIHFNGLQKTFDRIARQPPISFHHEGISMAGLLAVFFVLLIKIRTIEVTGDTRAMDLLLAPVLARWILVVFLYGAAAMSDGPVKTIAAHVKPWHLLLTTALTLGLAVYVSGRAMLWVALILSLMALLGRRVVRKRAGWITLEHSGAIVELAETLAWVLFSVS